MAETHQRPDQCAYGQQFECRLRQIEHGEQKCVSRTVAADADIALLSNEQEQPAQGQQHGHRHGRVNEHGAIQVAIESIHAVLASRTTRYKPSASAARCTHQTPSAGDKSPFSTHDLAAYSSCEYTKYTTMAKPTLA